MAGGLAVAKGGVSYNGKLTVYVVISCIIATMGGGIFGYDIGVSGGVTSMPPFLKKFFPGVFRNIMRDTHVSNYCKYDSQLLTAFTSSLYLAGLVASFFSSWVTRDFGRKPSTLFAGVCFLSGGVLNGSAVNISMLILGRILLGVGVGFANQSVPLYLSELAPAKYRGAINSSFNLATSLGVLIANLTNYGTQKIDDGWGWRVSLAVVTVPALILTIGTIFLPETPNSIIQRTDNQQKARAVLQRVRGTHEVDQELSDLIKANIESKSVQNPFRIILQRKYRPQLVIVTALPFFVVMTGVSIIGFYTPVLLISIGLSISTALLMTAVISGLIGAGSTVIAMAIIDKFGRRSLLLSGSIVMLVSYTAVGALMAAQLPEHGVMEKGYAYLVLVIMCAYMAGFGWSWGPMGVLIPSEVMSLEIRSAGQSIAVAVNLVFTFVIAQLFLTMLCHMRAGIFFFFSVWMALMTTFAYFLVPETANIPIERMDSVWKDHWFWNRFVDNQNADNAKTTA